MREGEPSPSRVNMLPGPDKCVFAELVSPLSCSH